MRAQNQVCSVCRIRIMSRNAVEGDNGHSALLHLIVWRVQSLGWSVCRIVSRMLLRVTMGIAPFCMSVFGSLRNVCM